jgi:hypothetical protein
VREREEVRRAKEIVDEIAGERPSIRMAKCTTSTIAHLRDL